MRKLLLIIVSVFCLNAIYAQNDVVLSYSLEPKKTQLIPVILRGPSPDCQTIPLTFETTYLEDENVVNMVIRTKYEKPLLKREQYTHLWFPIATSGLSINKFSLDNHFKKNYRSKVAIGPAMQKQLFNFGYAGLSFLPAFQCENGEIQNQRQSDIMLSLVPEKVVVLKIKVLDDNNPVNLKISNVIPLKARFEFPMIFNKATLKYISNSYSISLKFPKSSCFGQQDQIDKYKQWNKSLNADYEQLLNFLIEKKDPSGNSKESVTRKLQVLSKYENARKGIKETNCDELMNEYNTFHKYYNKIGEGIVTADSFQRMITQMDALIDDISIARNTGNGRACRKFKENAAKFNDVVFDESLYSEFPELKSLAKRFIERRELLNNFKCPGESGGGGSGGQCHIDTEKIKAATMKINNLLNEYRLKKVKNEQTFYSVVKETDSYLKGISDACKNSKKYQTIIQQYRDAKNAYQNTVK